MTSLPPPWLPAYPVRMRARCTLAGAGPSTDKGPAWSLGVALPLMVALAVAVAVAGATPAVAHEPRDTGGFHLVVGWGEEPPYTGVKNTVHVTVSEANGGPPVTDVAGSLQVEVMKGSETRTLSLEANFGVGAFGAPGDYRAGLIPTRPGTYTFRVIGSIRGQSVDESFTSSPATFDDVQDVAEIQFPAKDPSTGQLATRMDREIPRLATRVEVVEAVDRLDSIRNLAMVAMVAGGLGLLTAGGALAAARSASRRGGRPKTAPSEAPAHQERSPGR